MDPVVERVTEAVRRHTQSVDDTALVLLSGGRDSVCLIDSLVKTVGAEKVSALHINYQLRGAESQRDQQFCEELCQRLGVALEVRVVQYPGEGNKQAWAREVRYGYAQQLATESKAKIFTAHTADDQVETVLYRMISAPASTSLLGMREVEGSRVRPLLGVWRDEVTQYCQARKLSWCEDSTNSQPIYQRNRIRSEVVPLLTDLNSQAKSNLLTTVDTLKDELKALDAEVERRLDSSGSLTLKQLQSEPPAVGRLLVKKLAERAAGDSVPFSPERFTQLLELLSKPGSGSLSIGSRLTAMSEYGRLTIEQEGDDLGSKLALEKVVLPVPGCVKFGGYTVHCKELDGLKKGTVVDAALLQTDILTVRSRRPGDKLKPVGLGGHKLLKKILIDKKVPLRQRSLLPVVESAGEIVCIPGVVYSESFIASGKPVSPVYFSVEDDSLV